MVRADKMTEFFENSEIFITGGSGVVGKAIIEKLLRSCNVRRIYVLLRPKRQLTADQRLRKMQQARIFQVLNVEKPNEMDKLTAIPGDVALPGLGIDEEHMQMLQRVSIIYHCAATVRFDEPLRVALRLNVGGTLEALKIAENLQHLRIFVHISTFFSNPYLNRVEPKHYASPMDWRLCLRLVDEVSDDDLLDTLTRKLIVGFPNTYTFTKNLAESLVNDYHTRVPLIVYRPSIVLFSAQEPIPGYAPSLMGAIGLFSLVGAGLVKAVYLREDVHLDITPQDLGIKALCYYTVKGAQLYQQNTPKELLVYQTSSSSLIKFTFRQMAERMDVKQTWRTAPFLHNVLIPGCVYTQNRFLYKLIVFTMQILPALSIDLLLQLFRRPPVLMSIIRKGYQTLGVMEPFLFNSYDSSGISELEPMLDFTDGTDFSIREIVNNSDTWETVDEKQREMLKSIRHDLLKEDPSTLPRAKHIMNVKIAISKLIQYYLLYKLLCWVWYRFLAQHFNNLT